MIAMVPQCQKWKAIKAYWEFHQVTRNFILSMFIWLSFKWPVCGYIARKIIIDMLFFMGKFAFSYNILPQTYVNRTWWNQHWFWYCSGWTNIKIFHRILNRFGIFAWNNHQWRPSKFLMTLIISYDTIDFNQRHSVSSSEQLQLNPIIFLHISF